MKVKCLSPGCNQVFSSNFIKELVNESVFNTYKTEKQKITKQMNNKSIIFQAKLWFETLWDNVKGRFMLSLTLRDIRRCPSCSFIIQKDGGCNHMTCRKCSTEFHWCCGMRYSYNGHNQFTCFLMKYGAIILFLALAWESSTTIQAWTHIVFSTIAVSTAQALVQLPVICSTIVHTIFSRALLPIINVFCCDTVLIFLATICYNSSNHRDYNRYQDFYDKFNIAMVVLLILVLRFILPSSNCIMTLLITPMLSITTFCGKALGYCLYFFFSTAYLGLQLVLYLIVRTFNNVCVKLCFTFLKWFFALVVAAITYIFWTFFAIMKFAVPYLRAPFFSLLLVMQTIAVTRIMRVFIGAFMYMDEQYNNGALQVNSDDIEVLERIDFVDTSGGNSIIQYFKRCVSDDYNFDIDHMEHINQQAMHQRNRRRTNTDYSLSKVFDMDLLAFVFGLSGPTRGSSTSTYSKFMNILKSPCTNGIIAVIGQIYSGASMIEMFMLTYFVQYTVLLIILYLDDQSNTMQLWDNYQNIPWIFSTKYCGVAFYGTRTRSGSERGCHYGYLLNKYRQLFVLLSLAVIIGHYMPSIITPLGALFSILARLSVFSITLIYDNPIIFGGLMGFLVKQLR